MKEILSFVKWQWSQWELWQKGYIVGAFFAGAGLAAPEPYDIYLFAIPMIILFLWSCKWMVWDTLQESLSKYKKEKRQLLDVIKGD